MSLVHSSFQSNPEELCKVFRLVTFVRKQEDGWHVVVGFWWNEHATMDVKADDEITVGPWPSRQVARKEMRGDVRKLVTDSIRSFVEKGAKIIAVDYGGEVNPPDLVN